ncbi:MAG: hypothetical protein N2319_10620 [Candidatus Kapabacteria bacterium]|nr:hypothetical protein [Candidatus Kapabacteria bacterium]
MKNLLKIIIIIIFFQFNACELFETRKPEEPDTKKTSFQPPTSPSITISNFINSIIEKNPDNYASCFYNESGELAKFSFIPSNDVKSAYSALFQDWNIQKERIYFYSLINNLPLDVKPDVKIEIVPFEVLTPDSAIFNTSYFLYFNHNIENYPKVFSGNLQFTIVPNKSGLWSILRWIDNKNEKDTNFTWSVLKVRFSN